MKYLKTFESYVPFDNYAPFDHRDKLYKFYFSGKNVRIVCYIDFNYFLGAHFENDENNRCKMYSTELHLIDNYKYIDVYEFEKKFGEEQCYSMYKEALKIYKGSKDNIFDKTAFIAMKELKKLESVRSRIEAEKFNL